MLFRFGALSILILTLTLNYNVDANHSLSYETNEVFEQPSHHQQSSWLKSAQDMISSPAGNVVVHMAKELLNRSTGNSQILSLNVTNLLIIILLKMLIFAAGLVGAGHWGHYGGYGYARSINDSKDSGLANGEDFLITGFLAAQGSGADNCLYAAACENPNMAYEYARAAKALTEGIQNFNDNFGENSRYTKLIKMLETGAYDGYRGIPCNTTSYCENLY